MNTTHNGFQKRTTWSELEIETLKENFPCYNTKQDLMEKLPQKSWNAILNMARNTLHLKKSNRWEMQKRRDVLISEYFSSNKRPTVKEAANIFNIPENLIYKKLEALNIKPLGREVSNNLKILLDETPISGYWLGFVMADGSFPSNKTKSGSPCQYLSFWLSKKDENHVKLFAKLIKVSNIREQKKTNSIGFTANDIKTVNAIFDKLGLSHSIPKTYFPPSRLNLLPNDVLFSLIIGYIDGDGSIIEQKSGKIRMAVSAHMSWMPICNMFDTFLYSYLKIDRISTATPTINSNGYSLWSIRDQRLLLEMKKNAIKLNLPILHRKWEKLKFNDDLSFATH